VNGAGPPLRRAEARRAGQPAGVVVGGGGGGSVVVVGGGGGFVVVVGGGFLVVVLVGGGGGWWLDDGGGLCVCDGGGSGSVMVVMPPGPLVVVVEWCVVVVVVAVSVLVTDVVALLGAVLPLVGSRTTGESLLLGALAAGTSGPGPVGGAVAFEEVAENVARVASAVASTTPEPARMTIALDFARLSAGGATCSRSVGSVNAFSLAHAVSDGVSRR
jgi:hypothetical protein